MIWLRAKLAALITLWKGDPEEVALASIATAYLTLLRAPHSAVRVRNQKALCVLRDALATELNMDVQGIQDTFEYWASHGGPPPKSQAKSTD